MFAKIFSEIRGQWRSLSLILFLELLATPLALLSPVGMKIAIDNVLGGKSLPSILQKTLPTALTHSAGRLLFTAITIQLFVVVLIQAHWFCNYLLKIQAGEKMLLNFRARLFSHLQRLPLNYHDVRGSSDSIFRIQDDATALKSITLDGVLFLFSDVVKLLAMASVTMVIDWRLGLVALSVAPFLAVYAAIYQRRVGARYKEVKRLDSSALQVVHEVLATLRVVKAFVQEHAEQRRFLRRSGTAEKARIRLAYADGIFGLGINLTTAAGAAVVLLVGIQNVQSGALTLGSLLLIITYLVQLYAPLQNITYHLASLKASAASVERAFEVFDAEPEAVDLNVSQQTVFPRAFGSIEFENVTFAYGSKVPILKDFSLDIPVGARVGLVGRTGAGKTTFVNLLMRFLSPVSGRILLDGRDIQALDLASLRRQFAFVLQEPVLFSATIAENIAYGRPKASREEIIEAARAASANEFIERLPSGYDTVVGERGSLLSGGERQRVSIARAFLQDAPILVLDEPTSALDVGTEGDILKAINRLIAGRTCFLISHRLNALENCDFILKLSNGAALDVAFPDRVVDLETDSSESISPRENTLHLV